MSYTRLDSRDETKPRRMWLTGFARVAGMAVWAVAHVALLFAEHIAELLAPILLLAGAAWWALPRGLDALQLDGPAGDILSQVRAHVPAEVAIGGAYYSAHTLIADGLLCVAVVAICRTGVALLTNLLLDRT